MTVIEADAPGADSRRARRRQSPRGRWGWNQTVVLLIASIGAAVLAYPAAASWFAAWIHGSDVSGYVESVEQLPGERIEALLSAARHYNRNLPNGPLRDPYALGADGQQTAVGDGSAAYFETLVADGTDAMARVRIPKIGVDLPVFHGTSDDTLARGIGHLYGSSLPIGGAGTHAVLTGHNGFVQATMFDDIDELVNGDIIIVTTLGEDLHYEVDETITVLPDETKALRQAPGADRITLVTCTPTGVNTHRLLVRAERIPAPAQASGSTTILQDASPIGSPWWALFVLAVPVLSYLVVRPQRRTPTASQAGPR